MRARTWDGNNSILYLALLSLIYFLFVSGSQFLPRTNKTVFNPGGKIYIEIEDGDASVVKTLDNPLGLKRLSAYCNIDSQLKSGDKVVVQGGKAPEISRMSGLKSLSLGIMIGINSAGVRDLEALPGIGKKLALRIVSFRNEKGRFNNEEELLEVEGMGMKKLALVKPYIDLN
jgi:competence ComEA-like helix-hairpin-helix protein